MCKSYFIEYIIYSVIFSHNFFTQVLHLSFDLNYFLRKVYFFIECT